jgi:hypothetical protein
MQTQRETFTPDYVQRLRAKRTLQGPVAAAFRAASHDEFGELQYPTILCTKVDHQATRRIVTNYESVHALHQGDQGLIFVCGESRIKMKGHLGETT